MVARPNTREMLRLIAWTCKLISRFYARKESRRRRLAGKLSNPSKVLQGPFTAFWYI